MRSRTDWLNGLLTLELSPAEVAKALASLPWDSEELVQFNRNHLRQALRHYVSGDHTGADLQRWAELIEGRDDIGFEPECAIILKEIVFEIASPELAGPLTAERARELLLMVG